jgi:hypothetical protein
MSNGRELKTGERLDVRQVGPVKIDVMKAHEKNQGGHQESGAGGSDYKADYPTQTA